MKHSQQLRHLPELYRAVAGRVRPPVAVILGPPWPVARLVQQINCPDVTCVQMDLHQGDRLRECLQELGVPATVEVVADLWDLPQKFQTAIFPAAAHADRELKLDMVEQAYHILVPGGTFLVLSEYSRDRLFAPWLKKVYGRYGATPAAAEGMALFSARPDTERPRRRHQVSFHARIGDRPAVHIDCWPGTFSYGRFDAGSRAMLEIAELRPGDRVLDLGCGNGAVGCLAAQAIGPGGQVTFIDSNVRAVALARHNAAINGVAAARFVAARRLEGLDANSFDVILANPPYYALNELTQLFIRGARPLLTPGGRYYLVTKIPQAVVPLIFETFGDCTVTNNRGYAVIAARREERNEQAAGPSPLRRS